MGEMFELEEFELHREWAEKEAKLAERNNRQRGHRGSLHNRPAVRCTEDILNSKRWVTANGEILELDAMENDHLRNTLRYLYKQRDRYWLNCRDGKLIEQFENGEDFFQRVIRKSTLWTEAIRVLTEDKSCGFNFDIDLKWRNKKCED